MLQRISWIYNSAGFIEEFENCNQEALELNGDSASYFSALSGAANHRGNYKKAIEYAAKAYALNQDRTYDLWLMGYNNMMLGQYDESMKYYKKYVEKQKDLSYFSLNGTHRIGFVYWENGYKKEAESYFDMQIKYSNEEIKLERGSALTFFQYYDLAGIYAFRGEREKAYENLRIFNQRQWMPLNLVRLIKDDPLFNSIRNEPEFQQIVRDVEAKYLAEHERVRKWLEEQGML
jgi:tetratricopeptide (TPR) repeat protein